MFWQERHSQPIQQGIQPSLDLQDHLNKVNKDQSQGKILIFKFSLIFVKGSCWEGYLGHKIIGSLQMRVSKKQFNKNPLRQQLKVMPLLVVNHSEIIIITNWEHQKKRIMFNHGTVCSFSGIWTAFWISFWSWVRTAFLPQINPLSPWCQISTQPQVERSHAEGLQIYSVKFQKL